MPRTRPWLGRCTVLFFLAGASDVAGLGLILTGIFANLEKNGRSFGEFLIYSGGILLFFSLLFWLAWYSFNLEVSMEELLKDTPITHSRSSLVQLARKLSERLSKKGRKKGVPRDGLRVGQPCTPNLPGEPLHLSPSDYVNNGFTSCHLDSPTPTLKDRPFELSGVSSLDGHLILISQEIRDRLV
ncbi:hypothetical protein FKM82_007821 [Ascaphus truei]|uniref:transmembrane protein 238-like n=1 Tax=Ascaphus truei TaxID=8439 RepID=UPI003F5A08DD